MRSAAKLLLALCCVFSANAAGAANEPHLLISEDRSGGLSVNGPCHSSFAIYDNGKWSSFDNDRAGRSPNPDAGWIRGKLADEDFAKIKEAIKSSKYETIAANTTLRGSRPSAGDGSDITITVVRDGVQKKFNQWEIADFYQLEPMKTLAQIMTKYPPKPVKQSAPAN